MLFVDLSRYTVFFFFYVYIPKSDFFFASINLVFICEIHGKWNDETKKYTNKMAGKLIHTNSSNPF